MLPTRGAFPWQHGEDPAANAVGLGELPHRPGAPSPLLSQPARKEEGWHRLREAASADSLRIPLRSWPCPWRKKTGNSQIWGELYPRGCCSKAKQRARATGKVWLFVLLMAICFQSCTNLCLARQIFSLFYCKTSLHLAEIGT